MKKLHNGKLPAEKVIQNPVAKYAHQFNKAQVFTDKTKYQRNAKHKGKEPFRVSLVKDIVKGFWVLFDSQSLAPIFQQR